MKIALGQINPTIGDFSGNSSKIVDFSHRAADAGASLVVFPEMSVSGYPARDLVEKADFISRNQETVLKIAEQTQNIAVICGFVTPARADAGKSVMNSAAVLQNGKISFLQSKMLLPTYDVFDEARYFAPALRQDLLAFDGRQLALTICEDGWNDKRFWQRPLYSVDPVEQLLKAGGDLLINISASPFSIGKPMFRRKMFQAIALQYRVPVILVNQIGGNDNLVFDGGSFAIAADGRTVASAKSFVEDLVIVDSEDLGYAAGKPKPAESKLAEPKLAGLSFAEPKLAAAASPPNRECYDHESDEADAYSALVLGTRDYVQKCGFERVLIGLSGGIDSALAAAIATDALGKDNVIGVAMPGPYSSDGSIVDARELAQNLGIRFEVLPIDDIFKCFKCGLEPVFAELKEDVTEENIQSRIRGTLLMALSNKFGALVLSTGNKSELAVGYCTLYGDMVGGLAVISDVPKTMVYRLSRYVNTRQALIPQSTIEKPPSAELRPGQKDSDFLPPYEILDSILEDYVEDYRSAEHIAAQRGYDIELVRRIVRMIQRSEYKRQQAAPGIKITEKAFGGGRRFPIAQKYEL